MDTNTPFFQKLKKAVSVKRPCVLEEVPSGAKALLASFLLDTLKQTCLYISAESSPKILSDLEFFGKTGLELPHALELERGPDILGLELQTLSELKKNPIRLVSLGIEGLNRLYTAPDDLKEKALFFTLDQNYGFDELETSLSNMGYTLKSLVTEKGTFAKRGGIIDVFPYDAHHPIRMEFDDDKLISLRQFDPVLQTSIKKITSFNVIGCMSSQEKVSLLKYISDSPLIIFDGLEGLEEQWLFSQKLKKNSITLPDGPLLFFAEKKLSALFEEAQDTSHFLDLGLKLDPLTHPFLPVSSFFITSSKPNFDELKYELEAFHGEASIVYATEAEKNVILEKDLKLDLKPGFLSSGYYIPETNVLTLSFLDFSEKRHLRRQALRLSSTGAHTQRDFELFNQGDVVVHAHQGIGKCLGVEKRVNHLGQEAEYFKLEFADKAILYVPIKDAHLLTRYVGSSESMPTFSQLGSSKWQKIRAQTQASIIGYAKKLLELAAKRQMHKGFHYPEDSLMQTQFEEDFPFIATDDQLKAIASIKDDMQKGVPMDRLICGDVGYGKTEVAMRAAFKAVADGRKQVCVLVPTTVLAMQHFENFKERMSNFPITLGILSRFSSPKEIKATLSDVKEGKIDILIGTHRLLSPDVVFKDLGLLIIDEEQRFGVKAKETLKELKSSIDCLTLSATPIPRTLYTSIVGMRQMSVIATPPYDRLPVRTILSVSDDTFIKEALLKELSRKGQAYFIHNRVENLPLIHKKLKTMIPEANIGIAHGQMDPEEIDTIFHAFKTGALDILIATTLVENGVDIPNANTIFIDNAHHFGISDLYQLRGRVGRWNKAATCFLLLPKNHNLDESSRKRLEAIVSTSGFGGGLKVAMRDLEIRGAGDLLGIEQSGHVSQVGFTLYCKMLKKTVLSMQNNKPLTAQDTKIDFSFEARIPDSYIFDLDTRIEFYHRFGDVDSEAEADNIYKEMIDRFGQPPVSAVWLYVLAKIRAFAQSHFILSMGINKMTTVFEKSKKGQIEKHAVAISSNKNPLEFFQELSAKILKDLKN
jgi:transcription-repair coupling factor (superfamily II helicase)